MLSHVWTAMAKGGVIRFFLLAPAAFFYASGEGVAHDPLQSHAPTKGASSIDDGVVADWTIWPHYALGQNAYNQTGPRVEAPQTPLALVRHEPSPLTFFNRRPTERKLDLLDVADLPRDAITVEMWLCDHVNQPVGVLLAVRPRVTAHFPAFLLGYYEEDVRFSLHSSRRPDQAHLQAALSREVAFKEYWRHIVATYDGHQMQLFVNGRQVGATNSVGGRIQYGEDDVLELAAYMESEPHMDVANLLHHVRIHRRALAPEEIQARFEELCGYVEHGVLYPNLFHFNAGPYLNFATQNSINVLWETDRPAGARVRWGNTADLDKSHVIATPRRIQETTIGDLAPNSPYFYEVEATDDRGQSIKSGLLTFQTAVQPGQPFKFGLIGDTEARPHINNRIAQLLWEERPDFLVNLGDLTDGGMEDHKFEWNMEYFVGMNHLTSRVPVFAVPGNGEGDLYWYKRYHAYPDLESVYSFRYGDAEFFMLDSNRKEEFAPGSLQYQWLDRKLSESTARWKFVCHHHAPFTSEENDYGDAWQGASTHGDLAIRRIVPVYEKHGVDVVMFGHLHLYERTLPIRAGAVDYEHGVLYLLAGGAGGNLEDFAPAAAAFSAKTFRGHHYCIVQITPDTLTLRMYDLQGAMRDSHAIHKKDLDQGRD